MGKPLYLAQFHYPTDDVTFYNSPVSLDSCNIQKGYCSNE